ncbi:hypothetical protein UlMin_003138 [Ulmus minor]
MLLGPLRPCWPPTSRYRSLLLPAVLGAFRNLERGVDILVATSIHLVNMIGRGKFSLRSIEYLTLYEADRMLDMGFEPQIREIVERMDMPSPGLRQTFPSVIQRLAYDFLSNYIFLTVGRVGSIQEVDKRSHLMQILHAQLANEICGKVRCIDFLTMQESPLDFCKLHQGFSLKSFKNGTTPTLVATDIASCGLDILHVAHFINFDLPKDIDDYIHRIGRSGRAGKSGPATAFFCNKNLPLAKALAELMQESNQEVPSCLNQHVERSTSIGQGKRCGATRFGGYDYRNAQSMCENYSYSSNYEGPDSSFDASVGSSYGASIAGHAGGGECYVAANADSYAPRGYGEGYELIVATGWD